ncbi:hypothetical protein RN001_001780 [Aquatica leii]|uniref:C2H2-type domain-containing protein n=1 Tax=Aquatica leii TaxID=1421715 RepID=A0AAN7SLH7_9COLE|nr:hypothetical protein RN001_001780 [Aquatica leii]
MSSSSKQVLTSDGVVVAAKKCKFEIIYLPTKSTTRINVLQNLKLTPMSDCCTSIDAVLQHPFPINQIEDVIADIQSHCGVTLLKNVCDELHEQLTPSTYSRSSLTSLPDPFHEVMDISCTCHDIQNTQVCLEHVGCEIVPDVNVKSLESSTADDLSGPVDAKVCNQCGHVFTRSDNLKRHLQNSCKGVAPNDEVKKRKFEDGGESSSKKKIDDNQEVIVNVRCNECQEDVLKAHYRGHLRSNRHKINACRFIDDEAAFDTLQEPDEECGEEDKQPDAEFENFDGFESSANWDSSTLPPQFSDPIDLDELINNHVHDI